MVVQRRAVEVVTLVGAGLVAVCGATGEAVGAWVLLVVVGIWWRRRGHK